MADEKRDAPRPFDVRTVEYLLKLMSEHDLTEVFLQEGEQRIRLRKGSAIPTGFLPPLVHPGVHTPGSPPSAQAPTAPPPPARNLLEIKSPMVGTFYTKPDPAKPDYVTVGSKVKPSSVVCKLEAMKIFNDITADCTGTIAEVCVKNGDPVEYNQVLFRVEPA